MSKGNNKSVTVDDIEAIHSKLEDFLKRSLSESELSAFDNLIEGGSLIKRDQSSSNFFKSVQEPDVQGLADALEEAVLGGEKEAGWAFEAGWTYYFSN